MGCIETFLKKRSQPQTEGLTLTWDVLKLKNLYRFTRQYVLINFNMGCIETFKAKGKVLDALRLTLTWDVLKHKQQRDLLRSLCD